MNAPDYLGSYYLSTLRLVKARAYDIQDRDRMLAVEELISWGLVEAHGYDFDVTVAGDERLVANQ